MKGVLCSGAEGVGGLLDSGANRSVRSRFGVLVFGVWGCNVQNSGFIWGIGVYLTQPAWLLKGPGGHALFAPAS